MRSSLSFIKTAETDPSVLIWMPDEFLSQGTEETQADVKRATKGMNSIEPVVWQEILVALSTPEDRMPGVGVSQAGEPLQPEPAIALANMQVISPWEPCEIKPFTRSESEITSPNPGAARENNPEQAGWFAAQRALTENTLAQARQTLLNAEKGAAQILHNAESRAAEILGQAEAQADRVYDEARHQGVAAAETETANLLGAAKAMVDEIAAWKENQIAQGESMMLRLVIDIAQSIFGTGVPLDPETLCQAFGRALAEAKPLGSLRIYLHPDDAEALGPRWGKQQAALSGQNIELVPSEIIKRGGCFIEGQYGSVDARVDTQFQLVKETLLSSLAEAGGGKS